jgi:hypothetical protein
VTVYEDMGVATDCVTGRAIVLAGPRRGYQATDVILPYILRNTTPEANTLGRQSSVRRLSATFSRRLASVSVGSGRA